MDTATPVTGVAVGSEAGTLAQASLCHECRHAEVLTPAVRWVLEQAEVDPLSAGVAVGTGPGLFTGLRVGVSTAKALAQAWGLPNPGRAQPRPDRLRHRHARRAICPVIDARRGRCSAPCYRHAPGGVVRVTDYQVLLPDQLAAGSRPEATRSCSAATGTCSTGRRSSTWGSSPPRRPDPGLAVGGRPGRAGPAEDAARGVHQPARGDPLYLRRPTSTDVEHRLAAGFGPAAPDRQGPVEAAIATIHAQRRQIDDRATARDRAGADAPAHIPRCCDIERQVYPRPGR